MADVAEPILACYKWRWPAHDLRHQFGHLTDSLSFGCADVQGRPAWWKVDGRRGHHSLRDIVDVDEIPPLAAVLVHQRWITMG
jgi:hypothetical protein